MEWNHRTRPWPGVLWLCMGVGCGVSSGPQFVRDRAAPLRLEPPGEGRAYVSSFALWQGWRMQWGYNHRLNRTGALIEQLPCRDAQIRSGDRCRALLTLAAASGSGPDDAQIEGRVALVAARGVQAASAARELVLRGREGEPLERNVEIRVPMGPGWQGLPNLVPVLAGLDAGSLGSADKLVRFAIALGSVRTGPDALYVPVRLRATLNCGSGECPPLDLVEMSFLVGVTVLASTEADMQVSAVQTGQRYRWEKREEVPPGDTSTTIVLPPRDLDFRVLALRSFEVELASELHLLDFGLWIEAPDGPLRTELRNWRPGMRNSKRPYSFFSYARGGEARWQVELVAFDFREAAVSYDHKISEIEWKPRGRNAFAPLAETRRVLEWEVTP